MNQLAAQKKLLVAESELNRAALHVHCANLKGAANSATRYLQMGRTVSPLLLVVAVAGGLLLASRRKTVGGLAARLLSGWQLVQTLKPLWAAFNRARNPGDKAETSAPVSGNGQE